MNQSSEQIVYGVFDDYRDYDEHLYAVFKDRTTAEQHLADRQRLNAGGESVEALIVRTEAPRIATYYQGYAIDPVGSGEPAYIASDDPRGDTCFPELDDLDEHQRSRIERFTTEPEPRSNAGYQPDPAKRELAYFADAPTRDGLLAGLQAWVDERNRAKA